MFGKLKDKLKGALSVFSKKTVDEAEEAPEIKEEEVEETSVEEPKEEKEEVENLPVEEVKEKPIPEEKEIEEIKEEKIIEVPHEEPKEEIVEEKEIPIPESYNVAKHKFEPDLEKIEEIEKEVEEKEEIKEEKLEEEKKAPVEKTEEKTEEPKPEVKEEPKEQPKKKSFFGKLKQTITTKTISEGKFDELFWDLEVVLLENNVSVEVIEKIKQDLKTELVDKPLPRDVPKKIEETLKNTLTEIVSFDKINVLEKIKEKEGPYIIAFFGINGSGKTTSIAKLSHLLQQNGLKTVLAASDTFRAAAIQQLEEHANKLDTKIIKHEYGSDAAAVAYDAIQFAQKNNTDVVLIDTAGRLHSNTNLMDELKKIVKVTNPDLKVFIGESITGNDCIEQARKFNELIDIDASVLTKSDVDEKGGAQLSIAYTIKKPILYLGTGQEYKDLEEFNTENVLKRLGF